MAIDINRKLRAINARLDKIAIVQLREEVARLHERVEQIERELYWAEQSLEMWRDVIESEHTYENFGLTQSGHIVALQQ
ncbi:hypothetical protein TDB9533_01253 [Thalassocella blandensis]|nr:hypothetical protein TDB9533_01253 [Thalassocella blandensis]